MTKPETTKLTIRLQKRQVEFAKRFAKRNGVTVTEVVSRYFDRLQAESLEDLHPDVQKLIGILPSDIDVEATRLEYLTEKYLK